jgi:hypothetical protein
MQPLFPVFLTYLIRISLAFSFPLFLQLLNICLFLRLHLRQPMPQFLLLPLPPLRVPLPRLFFPKLLLLFLFLFLFTCCFFSLGFFESRFKVRPPWLVRARSDQE